jgi:AraC family transcriptional regulator
VPAHGFDTPVRAPIARPIAHGDGWSISDVTCHLGPQDRPFQERFGWTTIAAVLDGTFQCRTADGRALLYPGALLLGNSGAWFECAHDHGTGDRCVAFYFDGALFEEIAATIAGSHRFRFRTAMLPPRPEHARPVLESALNAMGRGLVAADELAIMLAEIVIRASSGTAREERRITDVLRFIEARSHEPLRLPDLAAVARMSKYHFLRTFRRAAGITPHQFLLDVRMRRAAMQLRTTATPIAAIALDTGWGDLSTFNQRFRNVFGMNPRRLRRSGKSAMAMQHTASTLN